mgnify:FL=1
MSHTLSETRRLMRLAEECLGESSTAPLTHARIQAGIDALVQAIHELTWLRVIVESKQNNKRRKTIHE